MYIGFLDYDKSLVFTHEGTDKPFETERCEGGAFSWPCNGVFDYTIDVKLSLAKPSFIGAFNFKLPEGVLNFAELFVDGKLSARRAAETQSKLFGGEVSLPVGVFGRNLTLRLSIYAQSSVTFSDILVLGASDDGNPLVYPTPKSARFTGEKKKI